MENNNNSKLIDYTKEAFIVAFIMGASGFLAGYIGPIIISPRSNQGPLFGIFISGPLSFGLGIFIGFLPAIFSSFEKIKYKTIKIVGSVLCAIITLAYLLAMQNCD